MERMTLADQSLFIAGERIFIFSCVITFFGLLLVFCICCTLLL